MSRFFTITMLLLGLGLAAYDGFRVRERNGTTTPSAENGSVNSNDAVLLPTGNVSATDAVLLPTGQ
jgi:hypothetical protein